MVDIIQPLDFLGRMGGPANLPNLIGDASAITQGREREAATIQALQARALFEQSQAAQQIEQQQRAQAYQQALRGHLESPTAGSAANLSLQFPEYSKQINDAYALQDGAKRDGELRLKSTIYSRAHAGDWGAAGTELERYITAAKDAGEDVSDEEAMLAHLKSGDPAQQKMALGILGYDLATIVGPDKWADFHGNKVVGNALVGNTGDVKYEAPEKAAKPQYMNVDGTVIELGGKDGGNTFEAAHNFVAGVEGGYAARDGKSGAPVNYGVNQGANPDIDVKSLTPETAKQILHDRYFVPSGAAEIADPALATVVYDTAVNMGPGMAKAMLKASGGDVEKFLDAREKRYRAIGGPDLPGWLNRNAKLREAVGGMGGGHKVVYRAPDSSTRPAPPSGYQWNADGTQSAVRGGPADPTVSRAGGLKQLPANEVEKLSSEAENIAQMSDLVSSFKPAFSGLGSRGGNMLAAIGFGDETQNAQHDWWQSMEAVDNVVRNQLFGASLTAGEQMAWERTTVTPNMSPERINANLKRREAILKRALDRKVKVLGAAGYKADIGGALNSGSPVTPAASGWSIRQKGSQ